MSDKNDDVDHLLMKFILFVDGQAESSRIASLTVDMAESGLYGLRFCLLSLLSSQVFCFITSCSFTLRFIVANMLNRLSQRLSILSGCRDSSQHPKQKGGFIISSILLQIQGERCGRRQDLRDQTWAVNSIV